MSLPGPVHPERPEIDGFCFDELDGLDTDGMIALLNTGKVFLTEFRATTHDGREAKFGGSLIAEDMEGAAQEAARRGLGEVVRGVLWVIIPGTPSTPKGDSQ